MSRTKSTAISHPSKMKIRFYKPYITGKEIKFIEDIVTNSKVLSGDGEYTHKVQALLEKRYQTQKAFLTTSGTTALEMAVRLVDSNPGDEIICPSYTFSSTANAILLHKGLKIVFAEINPLTLNIDPTDIAKKITKKTKAIIVVHYAGIPCDMDRIMAIAKKNGLKVIEDAAQAIESKYKNRFAGTIGDFGCLSFHETKNITCGEGGALFINSNSKKLIEKAEIIREKGTNRSKFFRGQIDKYTWQDIGSSYLPSDILAAFLLAQLQSVAKIRLLRKRIFNLYATSLRAYERRGIIRLPNIPRFVRGNYHIFYIILNNRKSFTAVQKYLKKHGINAYSHYVPLHSSPQGLRVAGKNVRLPVTDEIGSCLLRLPLYAGMKEVEYNYVVKHVKQILDSLSAKEEPFKNYSPKSPKIAFLH